MPSRRCTGRACSPSESSPPALTLLLIVVAVVYGILDRPQKRTAGWRATLIAERDALRERIRRAEQAASRV